MPHPVLFEVNARQWLSSLSLKHGRSIDLSNVPEVEVINLRQKGFSHLWLMGVWPTGSKSRSQAVHHPDLRKAYDEALPGWTEDDIIGSPYAVAEYTINPMLGGEAGLAEFRALLASSGLKLILDFVPNHLGLDHAWLRTNPEFFVSQHQSFPDSFPLELADGTRFIAHGKDPYFPGWTDTAQLDYRKNETRKAMGGILLSLTSKCDGVRCDMAMLPLNEVFQRTWNHVPFDGEHATGEFWYDAVARVKQQQPEFLFLAEAYWGLEGRLCDLGFDYAYDKQLYDLLVHDHCRDIQGHVLGMGAHNRKRAHFLENHDEPRIATCMDHARHRAAAVLLLGLPGMRFLHDGQFEGLRRFARVQLSRRAQEPVDQPISELYESLLNAFSQTSLPRGEAQILVPRRAWEDNPTSECFTVIFWQIPKREDRFDLVVVNHAPHQAQCRVPLPIAPTDSQKWSLKDQIGPEQWTRDAREMATEGLFLDVAPRGAHLFSFTRR